MAQQTQEKLLSKTDAIAVAEKFVSIQGYTGTAKEVTLQPHALGARLDSGLWFVGFHAANLPTIRAVVIDAKTSSARLASNNIQQAWLLADDSAAAPAISTATVKTAAGKPKAASKSDRETRAQEQAQGQEACRQRSGGRNGTGARGSSPLNPSPGKGIAGARLSMVFAPFQLGRRSSRKSTQRSTRKSSQPPRPPSTRRERPSSRRPRPRPGLDRVQPDLEELAVARQVAIDAAGSLRYRYAR